MQGRIRGLWAVNTNGAVQSELVKEVTVLLHRLGDSGGCVCSQLLSKN